jgi:hypothetical protein
MVTFFLAYDRVIFSLSTALHFTLDRVQSPDTGSKHSVRTWIDCRIILAVGL